MRLYVPFYSLYYGSGYPKTDPCSGGWNLATASFVYWNGLSTASSSALAGGCRKYRYGGSVTASFTCLVR
jgi:hypothetical protein